MADTAKNPLAAVCVSGQPTSHSTQCVPLQPGWDSFPKLTYGYVCSTVIHDNGKHRLVVSIVLLGALPCAVLDIGLYQLIKKPEDCPMIKDGFLPSTLKNPLGPFTREGNTVGPYNGWKLASITTNANGDATVLFSEAQINEGVWDVQFFITPKDSYCPCYESNGKFGSVISIKTTE